MLCSPIRRLCSRASSFYAVRVGRNPGIYRTWDECQSQVKGYPAPKFKKFKTEREAIEFIGNEIDINRFVSETEVINTENEKETCEKNDEETILPVHQFVTRESFPSSPVVYTDGCCLSNGRSAAVAGIGVYWAPNHPMNISEHLDVEKPTNQKAELRAASRALECAIEMGLDHLEVRTDSMYTMKSMQEWVLRWEKTGYKNIQNVEEMRRLRDLCKRIEVTWVHVPGHQGVYGNEQADRLANEGADAGPD